MLLFPNAKKIAHKMWLINVEKIYHREAERIANDIYPAPKKVKNAGGLMKKKK